MTVVFDHRKKMAGNGREVLSLLAFVFLHLSPGYGLLARGLTGLADPNQELECAVKDLVLDYASYILPEVTIKLAIALQCGLLCC